ncbi:MAG TPA: hypothetical protein VK900_14140 [Anaerolineales bacterium]|nr:hypothetical protein [Anaerolineales bacterium]
MDTEYSDSYLVVERMIREGDVTALELGDLLATLESQRLISAQEHGALIELAAETKLKDISPRVRRAPASAPDPA